MDWQLLSIAVFVLTVFFVGVYGSRTRTASGSVHTMLLGNRQLPLWLGAITMTATWVGGGFVNGTAEYVYSPEAGLVWAQAPWGYALSLVLGGLVFARPLYRRGCTTLIDPFEKTYGPRLAAVLCIPAVFGELCWSAAILVALGSTVATILDWNMETAILAAAGLAVGYTVIGGLWSVALTDAVQLAFILFGLLLAIPFALAQAGGAQHVIERYWETTRAMPEGAELWQWSDTALLLVFGGIPWQVYFQRVLASRDERTAVRLSVVAGCGCFVLALPAVAIGMIGATCDWTSLGLEPPPSPALVLPWVLQSLTPTVVATIGLSAVVAAVMSSVDSSILSASSLVIWNVYRPLCRPQAGDRELTRMLRIAIVLIGTLATTMALSVQSVYGLWAFCSDFVYVILFPQLVAVLFVKTANRNGACAGLLSSLLLRASGGEPLLALDPVIPFPAWFPLRTAAMLSGLLSIVLVSRLTTDRKATTEQADSAA